MLLINSENYFLIVIGLVWIFGAVLQDLKRREVDNIWNFSLIAFALAYRFSLSVYTGNYWFFLNGVLGFVLFVFFGNFFYYVRLFAGGDAKLVIALGSVLPFSYNWITNFIIFGIFVVMFLVMGSVYSLIWAFVLVFENFKDFKKEFVEEWKIYWKLSLVLFFVAIFSFLVIGYIANMGLGILLFFLIVLFPLLLVFAKSVEESCLKKAVPPETLTEGEWLYKDIIVRGKKIKASWDGLSREDLALIKKNYGKKVVIREGIPFTPSFLLSFLSLIIILWRYRGWF